MKFGIGLYWIQIGFWYYQLATLLPIAFVTRFDSFCLFATSSLDIALRSPSSRTSIVAALAPAEPPGGVRSPSLRLFAAAAPAPAEPPGGARSPSLRPFSYAPTASAGPPGGKR